MKRGELIRQYIIDNVDINRRSIAADTAKKFKVTRQAVNKHIRLLVADGKLVSEGTTRNKEYSLAVIVKESFRHKLDGKIEEHIIWANDVGKFFADLPNHLNEIWHYGFTEMLNNAIDHSSGSCVYITVTKTAAGIGLSIDDNGVGIFKKIKDEIGLSDERQAVLELSKGKLTTDPDNHSGQGIFFTSRMFDQFVIISGDVHFSHYDHQENDWIWSREGKDDGTFIWMQLNNNSKATMERVFNKFSTKGTADFDKTIVPVQLAKTSKENLVSRSQAKRVLARLDKFNTVIFDFENVDIIGQAFADEVFRVFNFRYPNTKVLQVNANKKVKAMIERVFNGQEE